MTQVGLRQCSAEYQRTDGADTGRVFEVCCCRKLKCSNNDPMTSGFFVPRIMQGDGETPRWRRKGLQDLYSPNV